MPRMCGWYSHPCWSIVTPSCATGNRRSPRPSFTYTKTFASLPSAVTTCVRVGGSVCCSAQAASSLISMGSPAGAVPVKFTTPVIVAALSGLTAGAAPSSTATSPPVSASSPPPPQARAAISRLTASASIERFIIVLLGLIRFGTILPIVSRAPLRPPDHHHAQRRGQQRGQYRSDVHAARRRLIQVQEIPASDRPLRARFTVGAVPREQRHRDRAPGLEAEPVLDLARVHRTAQHEPPLALIEDGLRNQGSGLGGTERLVSRQPARQQLARLLSPFPAPEIHRIAIVAHEEVGPLHPVRDGAGELDHERVGICRPWRCGRQRGRVGLAPGHGFLLGRPRGGSIW